MGLYPNGLKTSPTITSNYGPRTPIKTPQGWTSNFHSGVDFVGFDNVRAAKAGTIIYAGLNGGNGNEIKVRHANGDISRYYHLARFVRTGGTVAEGEIIGIMGATGMVTGKHLHFRVDRNGSHIDPMAWLRAAVAESIVLLPTQRQVLTSSPVRRRIGAPNTSAPTGTELAAGEVGNFDGWVRGETVAGNNVWFRGAISGDWFWSGGFEGGANTTGLADLNKVELLPTQRRVLEGIPVRRRIGAPTTTATIGTELAGGEIGNFTGFIKGENVTLNNITTDIWFIGTSGDFFWSGGFIGGPITTGLEDKGTYNPNPTNPETPREKVVVKAGVTKRKEPRSTSEKLDYLNEGAKITVTGFVSNGESVAGNAIWLTDGTAWYWSGGFVNGPDTTGIKDLTDNTKPPFVLPTEFGRSLDIAWPQTYTFDWAKIKANNWSFAIMKASGAEGGVDSNTLFRDRMMASHLAGVTSVGMDYGFYHFYSPFVDPTAQAQYFADTINAHRQNRTLAAIDVENDGKIVAPDVAGVLKTAQEIKRLTGITPFIYMNRTYLEGYDWTSVAAEFPLWLAHGNGSDEQAIAYQPKYWEKASIIQTGVLPSIDGYPAPIDANIYRRGIIEDYGYKVEEQPVEGNLSAEDRAALEESILLIQGVLA